MANGLGYASEAKVEVGLRLPKKDDISSYEIPLFSQVEKHDSDGDVFTYVVVGKAALTVNVDLDGGVLRSNNTVRNEGIVVWQIGFQQNPRSRGNGNPVGIEKCYENSDLMGALRGGVVDVYKDYFRKILPIGEGLINSSRKIQDFNLNIYSASILSNLDSAPVERLLCDENPHHKFLGKWIVASRARMELEKRLAANDTITTVEFEEYLMEVFGYLDEKRRNHLLKVSRHFTEIKQRYEFARDTLELIIS